MRKTVHSLALLWISVMQITGCTHTDTKSPVFDDSMPAMKTIHDRKFHKNLSPITRPTRTPHTDTAVSPATTKITTLNSSEIDKTDEADFQWLPNPTLHMYVFKHLTPAGYPIPGYTTFFKLYTRDHIAEPGEQGGWE